MVRFVLVSLVLLSIACVQRVLCEVSSVLTGDGLEFTINQKNYSVPKFSVHGVELNDTQGYVSNDYLPLDNRGYQEVRVKCYCLKCVETSVDFTEPISLPVDFGWL
jgi:hypothetical protein